MESAPLSYLETIILCGSSAFICLYSLFLLAIVVWVGGMFDPQEVTHVTQVQSTPSSDPGRIGQ